MVAHGERRKVAVSSQAESGSRLINAVYRRKVASAVDCDRRLKGSHFRRRLGDPSLR